MRRFSTATVLGGLLLLGASWSLSASDAPKAPRPGARRKAVAPKQPSYVGNVDVKLENLYVDSEIGQVFTVNLGRADQQGSAGESAASPGSVQIYQLGAREAEPPAATEVAGQVDPADAAATAEDDETGPAEEMEAAPATADEAGAMAAAADDAAVEPAAEPAPSPEAAPQASQAPSQPDPSAAKPPAAKEAPPAASSQAPPPAPPPIR
jgi:hypothetical protein